LGAGAFCSGADATKWMMMMMMMMIEGERISEVIKNIRRQKE